MAEFTLLVRRIIAWKCRSPFSFLRWWKALTTNLVVVPLATALSRMVFKPQAPCPQHNAALFPGASFACKSTAGDDGQSGVKMVDFSCRAKIQSLRDE